MMCRHPSIANCLVLALCVAVSEGAKLTSNYTFAHYKEQFGRTYGENSEEHRLREAIFEARLADIKMHNARGASWKKGINHMTDYTEDELDMLLGHKPVPRRMRLGLSQRSTQPFGSSLLEGGGVGEVQSCANDQASCLEEHESCCSGLICGSGGTCEAVKSERAQTFDWSTDLATSHEVLEQGRCGSCWAVAAAAAINMHAEKASGNRFNKVLSPENLLACTPNAMECGGQGGCKGATAELAFDWLKSSGTKGGLGLLSEQGYDAKDDNCAVKQTSFLQKQANMVTIQGWKRLPENNVEELMNALVNVGPLVVSMAAKGLHSYDSGILDACSNLVVNHAVVMMGYGEDDMPYWNIRNSWGKNWGEKGFFRLQRFAPNNGEEPCGWDMEPAKGVACKDKAGPEGKYPEKQWVCGACAILTDTAYPTKVVVPEAFLQTESSTETFSQAGSQTNAKAEELNSCKTQCQHFAMPTLAKKYGMDFTDDPVQCSDKCDVAVA